MTAMEVVSKKIRASSPDQISVKCPSNLLVNIIRHCLMGTGYIYVPGAEARSFHFFIPNNGDVVIELVSQDHRTTVIRRSLQSNCPIKFTTPHFALIFQELLRRLQLPAVDFDEFVKWNIKLENSHQLPSQNSQYRESLYEPHPLTSRSYITDTAQRVSLYVIGIGAVSMIAYALFQIPFRLIALSIWSYTGDTFLLFGALLAFILGLVAFGAVGVYVLTAIGNFLQFPDDKSAAKSAGTAILVAFLGLVILGAISQENTTSQKIIYSGASIYQTNANSLDGHDWVRMSETQKHSVAKDISSRMIASNTYATETNIKAGVDSYFKSGPTNDKVGEIAAIIITTMKIENN